jgi:Holliday junction resolvase RusA-like endonuclease
MTSLSAIRFVVPGEPVPKGRSRARLQRLKSGREFIQQYTPADTRNYERSVAFEAKIAMKGHEKLTGGLVLLVFAFFSIPPSWPKWKQREARAGLIVPTGRPDWDNVGKICSDAMNDVVYADDSAIVDACVRKRFSLDPCIVIEVRMLNPLRREEPELLEPIGNETP